MTKGKKLIKPKTFVFSRTRGAANSGEDYDTTWADVSEMLKLEVERRHVVTGKGRALTEWIYEIIDGSIEPALETGQTEIVNQILELFKDKMEIEQKKNMLDEFEHKTNSQKGNSLKGLSFTKKNVEEMKN